MRKLLPLLLASSAFADDVPRIEVEVGKNFEKSVEYARGYMCDDPSILTAEMITRKDRNYWVVTGVKVGETLCRVGLDRLQVHYVFDVRVLPGR